MTPDIRGRRDHTSMSTPKPAADKAAKGGSKMMVIIIAVVVLAAGGGGGFWYLSHAAAAAASAKADSGDDEEPAAKAKNKKKKHADEGGIVAFEPFTVNLTGGGSRFLRTTIKLVVEDEAAAEKISKNEASIARIRSAIIELL